MSAGVTLMISATDRQTIYAYWDIVFTHSAVHSDVTFQPFHTDSQRHRLPSPPSPAV